MVTLAANAFRRLCHEGRKTLVNDIAPLAQLIRSTEGRIPVSWISQFLYPPDIVCSKVD